MDDGEKTARVIAAAARGIIRAIGMASENMCTSGQLSHDSRDFEHVINSEYLDEEHLDRLLDG